MDKKEMALRLEDLDVNGVVAVLVKWEMKEFVDFVEEKQIDGRKLLQVTEGILKLWQPKANAKKFIAFITQAKLEPDKYLELFNKDDHTKVENNKMNANIEAQYKTVNSKRNKEQTTTSIRVEEILKRIVPARSFLYRNQSVKADDKPVTSYVPMDAGTPKKKRFFRLSSYEYPQFDIKQHRLSKTETFNDRGYYSVKTNDRYYIQKTFVKSDSKTKYKSLSATEDLEKFPEDHFYEDLNYNDNGEEDNSTKELKSPNSSVKPCMVKIQELFSSFKLPFFKKSEETKGDSKMDNEKTNECESDGHIYENGDSVASMYDSIHVHTHDDENTEKQTNLPVEDYLEPVRLSKDYCDVARHKDESILSYILNLFESLGMKRETTEDAISDPGPPKTLEHPVENKPRSSMADRPLPVPVENEPYFMDIDRTEAENLLRGQPDGTFILRPSSQPDHAYTLTVSCASAVHNVGVRRRPDGRLALGFARRAERSFDSVTSLLRHHRKQRLLLVAGGTVCGATALINSPEYYQTPSELARPVK